jgi:hypothetical protein
MLCDCSTKYSLKSGQPCCLQKSSAALKNFQNTNALTTEKNQGIALPSKNAFLMAQQDAAKKLFVNSYEFGAQNYKGLFCICHSSYDEEDEDRTMFQCEICQDWFHDTCIGTVPNDSYFHPPGVDSLFYL